MARVYLENLGKSYGATPAVANFTLDIADGELVSSARADAARRPRCA